MASSTVNKPIKSMGWADDEEDEDFWQEMEVVKKEDPANGLDEEDQKKYHYVSPKKTLSTAAGNATGVFDDIDYRGREWRSKTEQARRDEMDYTRLRLDEDDDSEEIHLRTKFLFDEDKAMTPLNQMQATKNLLTEAQRIAYVGVCYLTCREMVVGLKKVGRKELAHAVKGMELWSLKIMGRLYYHMELAMPEQKMIETLAEHGVTAMDLVPTLMTTHTVANPEYDPVEAKKAQDQRDAAGAAEAESGAHPDEDEDDKEGNTVTVQPKPTVTLNDMSEPSHARTRSNVRLQTTANVLEPSTPIDVPGVSTHLSNTDTHVTLDIRWTVLCDLFLILIADSVYDARSRVLLETMASKLGIGWSEVVRFEKRVTDALEIEEGAESLESRDAIEGRIKSSKRRRYVMMGLATLGGGLVMGLSAGLLAPVIGAGIAGAFATIGVSGGSAILGSVGGAAVITTTGVLTGSGIAGKGMARRTQHVTTFEILPMHNSKRVNCILTIPGFMTNINDDVRLPFSVLDPIVGDVFSVRWEPEMMGETGNALSILSTEVLSQVSTTVLSYTVLTALMGALQWPMLLTKLGYLIDNPWSNALDRAKAAGLVLADVLMARSLGVRPITLIGFSLGARMIFYCLVELGKRKALGIVQDVFLLGATVTAPVRTWCECRSVVAGRFVNGFARNDWILGYLFRATTGGLNTVAGLRPVDNVPGLENVDLTDKIAGHTSYRSYMPLILDQLGFPVSADYFDEPEEMMIADREVVRETEEEAKTKKRFSLFGGRGKEAATPRKPHPPGPFVAGRKTSSSTIQEDGEGDDELPERLSLDSKDSTETKIGPTPGPALEKSQEKGPKLATTAGFDLKAIHEAVARAKVSGGNELEVAVSSPLPPLPTYARSHSTPVPQRPAASQEVDAPSSPTTPTAPYQKSFFSGSDTSVNRTAEADEGLARRFEATRIADAEEGRLNFPDQTSATPYSGFQQYAARRESLNATLAVGKDTASWASPFDTPTPTLSFGGADGSIWTPGTGSTGRFDASLETPAAASSGFGMSKLGQIQNEGFYKAPAYNVSQNSTAGSGYALGESSGFKSNLGSNPLAGSSTISFGADDGTISVGPTSLEKDVWAPKPIMGGTKRPAYTVNPWES